MKTTGAVEEWRGIARGSDVLFSIASVPGKQGSWTAEEFYAHGRADWLGMQKHWDQYWPERGGTCLEIGCGAGRITAALAEAFDRVIAVDVSQDMIDRAREVVPGSAEFHQVDGAELPVASGTVDGVFSVHVMQHLEDREALVAYLREIRRVLRPGGSMMVHIELVGEPPPGRVQALREELRLRRSRRALRRGQEHSEMRMRRYWFYDVYQMLAEVGLEDLELRLVTPQEFGHPMWLARSPG